MSGIRVETWLLLSILSTLPGCAPESGAPGESEPKRGVFVERVPAGALRRAGIEMGERLLEWRRPHAERGGALASPFELSSIEREEASRGIVELRVASSGKERWVPVPPGRWHLDARPSLDEEELDLYRSGLDALDASDDEKGEGILRRLSDRVPPERAVDRAWVLSELAKRLEEPRADAAMSDAIAVLEPAGDPGLRAHLHAERGRLLDREGRLEDARAAHLRSLELYREAGQGVGAAIALAELGRIEGRRGDPSEEERLHREALEELDRVAPDSLEVSRVLRGLARSRATQDDVDEALAHAGRSLDIAARLAPGGFDHQAAIMIHGIFHWFQEEWDRAEARLLEALEIVQALDPEHQDVSNTLHNLGLVASYRGDQAQASDYFIRALETDRTNEPIRRTRILNSLGTLAIERYDLEAAERWLREVLDIRERLTPGSLNVATPLVNLGEVAQLRGSFDEAERLLERALALQRRWIPESRDPAMTLHHLATVSRGKGDLERAEERALEALAIVRDRFPGVLLEAAIRHTLGAVRHEAGRHRDAEPELELAIAIFERLAPDTTAHALAVYELGRVQREAGRRDEALETLLAAVAILERQVPRLGGSDEVRSRFRGELLHLYRDALELLLDLGRPEEAFHLLERSQARSLAALLAERGIALDRGLPPEYAELSSEYDRLSEELAELSSESDRRQAAAIARRLDQLRLAREEVLRRSDDPRRGILADAREALDVERSMAALPEDAVALSFCVTERRSWVFLLGPGRAFRWVELGIGEAELEDRIDRLRLLIDRPGLGDDGYRHLAARLFRDLVAPGAAEIERARRIVVVPDGPLHLLPFAVLFQELSGSEGRHLVEWRPLQIAPSLTVLAALRQRPAPETERDRVVAFVDPQIERDESLAPLPHARREAEDLRRLFRESTVTHVGTDATERRALQLDGDERILHFATHGVLDRHSPLDSGLVLNASPPDGAVRDNGLLQAWEIFERLRTSADLVTLSACESASGLRIAGEGLMSLTRAFQFAGARSVLASLWQVSDRSTALLMKRFYQRIAAGERRDEALRAAQLALLRGESDDRGSSAGGFIDRLRGALSPEPDYRHPYYWAAFQIYGPGGEPSVQQPMRSRISAAPESSEDSSAAESRPNSR